MSNADGNNGKHAESNLEVAADDEDVDSIPSTPLARLCDGGVDGVERAVALPRRQHSYMVDAKEDARNLPQRRGRPFEQTCWQPWVVANWWCTIRQV